MRYIIRSHDIAARAACAVNDLPVNPEHPYVVSIGEETRSSAQNRKVHAVIGDIARSCEFMDEARTMEQWKILLVSAHYIATGNDANVMPGLEGEFVTLRESTARMTKGRMISLIEYCYAWGSQHGADWSDDAIEVFDEFGVGHLATKEK